MKYLDVLTTGFHSNLIGQQALILLVSQSYGSKWWVLGVGGAVLRFEIAQVMSPSSERHTPPSLSQTGLVILNIAHSQPAHQALAGRAQLTFRAQLNIT